MSSDVSATRLIPSFKHMAYPDLFELQDILFTVKPQVKASTFYMTFHSVHPMHDIHLVINLSIFLILANNSIRHLFFHRSPRF